MKSLLIVALVAVASAASLAQSLDVTGAVSVVRSKAGPGRAPDPSSAVVWLRPIDQGVPVRQPEPGKYEIRQQHKRFDPPVLAVPAGSVVAFPNLDPFFHNVFSLYDGKRFDLGLYEAGASRSVTFDHAGICYVFCNIHPEMAAAVVVLDTPYYALSNAAGEFRIAAVPAGRYLLFIWHQRGKPEHPESFPQHVIVGPDRNVLAPIRLVESDELVAPHTNKYGRSYDRASPAAGPYK